MARAKKHKHNNRRRQGFYEALPMSITPPAVVPAEPERIISDGLSWLTRVWQSFRLAISTTSWDKLWHFELRRMPEFAQLTGDRIISVTRWISAQTIIIAGHTGRLSRVYALRAFTAAGTAADAVVSYTPPIAADFAQVLRRLRRRLTSRIAKRMYITLSILALAGATAFGAVTALHTINAFASSISSPAALLANKKTGTTILDRNGQVLYEAYGAQHTTVDPLSQLPASLVNATLSAEDPGFFSEPAISIKGTLRAAWVDITHHGDAVEGGSTLTQQLVKNALLNPNKSYWRKYQEILLAFDLEQRYSKNQILDMYLNETYYGEGASGVEAASQTYFHKPASQLTLSESALIAGLPLGPSYYDPNASVDDATGRRNYVLSRMAALGKITADQAQAAESVPIVLANANQTTTTQGAMTVYSQQANVKAPWFDYYVLDQLRQQYGDQMVEQGDLTVKTTLDLNKETEAEGDIQNQISKLGSHNVTNGALVSLDPKTGDILAMVGSVDYNAPGFGQVNATVADLQPGSSFKPIVYATAFEKGYTGATTVDDAPITFPGGYSPQNYDLKYHGVVTLRHALDNSLNVPAVKVMQFAGIPASLKTAHDMGITTLNDPSQYGLSLVLGAGDVTPLDMATVYATFDNLGEKVEPRAILSVTNRDGKNITKPDPSQPKQVLDPRIAFMITNILSDVNARLPEFPANSPLTLDRVAAAKTGTTTDFDDNWTIGYTPQIVTAVWVGNNNHTPMQNVDGITGAAPIWHDYMEQALAGTPVETFAQPEGVVFADVCSNGALAQGFSTGTTEVFMAGHLPSQTCSSNNAANQNVAQNNQPTSNNSDNNNGNSNNQQADNPPPAPPSPSPIETPPVTPAPPVIFPPPGG